jgi:hypothetical protein
MSNVIEKTAATINTIKLKLLSAPQNSEIHVFVFRGGL